MTLFYRTVKNTAAFLFRILFGVKTFGEENLNFSGPAIIASNHISLCDPPLLGSIMPIELNFMAKASLFKNKIFGRFISALNAFPVRRGVIDRQVLHKSQALLQQGKRILIFPEGTRQKDGILKQGRPGLAKIAISNHAPIIPVYIHGTNHLKDTLFASRKLLIVYGEMIKIESFCDELTEKECVYKLTEKIMEEIKKLQEYTQANLL